MSKQVDQIFIPGRGWIDCRQAPLATVLKKRWAIGATHVRIVGRGDYSLVELGVRS